MTYRLFEGKDHAASYWKYRISPSDDLLQQVLGFLEKHNARPLELAVDVGCGSGQGTLLLAKHFASVVGTDVSPAQLEVALQHNTEPNVTYRQCVAEELPFADCSVDLVTAMSAFHWFDRARFLQEAHRVLKPRGCLALLNYTIDMELSFPNCSRQELNQICKEFYAALHPYCSPHLGQSSIQLYREAYESIPYPDKEWQECVWDRKHMPLSNFMGLVESFSSYQALLKDDPKRASSLSQVTCQRLMSCMNVTSADAQVEVGVKYFYLLTCKPQDS
ncbi:putative methyltransferase [Oryzias melastigma]|uniref:Putative methyltransferase n=1 Tax=Oryzias melastigma TaxID=30732 RepID=A0A3B3DDG6_ORYME|nr:putative methyltransferase DDB_G0268948 [Oryzias melastigma]KAF6734281.1 putative methyltransferase [Oryzias melastigma]